MPINIYIEFGAGEENLNLSNLNLRDVNLKMGAGDVKMDMSGNYSESFNVNIAGGVGRTTLYLPKDIGVNVRIQKGIGKLNADGFIIKGSSYVNEAYGKSNITINVDIKASIGEFILILK